MQVQNINDVKIYNLSVGKSLPEWLSERKRRSLLKKNVDVRKRIELIQEFDMPGVSTSIRASNDGQYIMATGIYKPRLKCFDVNNLSLKFERCFDSEVVTFEILSDDYSKLIFLQCDRHIEFHAAHGKYYRLRIPRFGRDMKFHYPSCDLFVVGVSNEIYRLNLERGQFLQPYITETAAINKCCINPVHHVLLIGTEEGKVEAWDPRVKNKVATLDCAFHCIAEDNKLNKMPSITALKCQGGLSLGVGTVNGQVLLYDIRSNKPYIVKDHMYGLPIRNIEFHESMDLIYSMDSSIVKIWEKQNGKLYTSIEAQSEFNDLCIIPNTGMLFMATESTKMQTYYIPSLGPAPRWCGFLDNLTEELEELDYETVYDDYKFVTDKELEELGLEHLKGTNLLRAYMHGHFMDVRLYRKARDVMKPFDFDEYKKKKIRQKIEEERTSKIQVHKLPAINQELALKHMEMESNPKMKKKKQVPNLLQDDRFKSLFDNPDFQIDKNSEQFALLNPVISRMSKSKHKKESKDEETEDYKNYDDEDEIVNSADEDFQDSSSEDEKEWVKEVKKQYRLVKKNEREKELEENEDNSKKEPQLYEIKEGVAFRGSSTTYMRKRAKATLGKRLQEENVHKVKTLGSRGNREMTFTTGKRHKRKIKEESKRSRQDFKQLLRPARHIGKKKF